MDLSRWYNINKYIKVCATQRKFYGQFNYKLVYAVPGAFVIPCTKDNSNLHSRISHIVHSKHSRYSTLNVPMLETFFELYQNRGTQIRIRVEGSTLSIFGRDLDHLYDLASGELAAYTNNLISVTAPVDAKQQELLDQGKIILKTSRQHHYRVTLRSGAYRNFQERQALVKYLINLDDQVEITKNLLDQLNGGNKYLYGGYFYVSDTRIVDMIALIIPNLIRSVNQVVVVP